MSYHLIKSPAKLSMEHAAANCGGDGQEVSSMDGSGLLPQPKLTNAEMERITGWITEITWIVFMFSFVLAVGVFLVLWCCSRRRGGEHQDAEEQSQFYMNRNLNTGHLLRSPVTLSKSNEKIAEDGSGVMNKEEGDHGAGKGDM